jgi:hypothetical protein
MQNLDPGSKTARVTKRKDGFRIPSSLKLRRDKPVFAVSYAVTSRSGMTDRETGADAQVRPRQRTELDPGSRACPGIDPGPG